MNPFPSKYATRVLARRTCPNRRINVRIVTPYAFGVAGLRFKSHSSIQQEKNDTTAHKAVKSSSDHQHQAVHMQKSTQSLGDATHSTVSNQSAQGTSTEDSVSSDVQNDSPLPYQNTHSEWQDSSSLSPYLRKHPSVYRAVKFFYDGFGLYAKQSDAVRTGKKTYMTCCERDLEEEWIYDACRVPRTFHSWFQITNLHVWLLTVRFRALPPPHGKYILQAFVDFFFQDIEDRLRALLGPRISERTITSYMKEYRDLWNGSQLALDIGLVGGDWELAGAIWRNLFDAKGWDLGGKESDKSQIADTSPRQPSLPPLNAHDLVEEPRLPQTVDMPQNIYTLVAYLRHELKRLEEVSDEDIILKGDTGPWGPMNEAQGRDSVNHGSISPKEFERWRKFTDEIGKYR
ncbi:Protein cbp3, mitochondrial [Serendipita sp. 411]|nr:Protein cbp3, mitochondrial [Serendipita sp. 401]KAG8847164.1 Protein cbp3, mitochondrial [Serendipita sp. 411]KAG9051988.1 Protein cbp3, mitochondrial [Serendipita sp. 407]